MKSNGVLFQIKSLEKMILRKCELGEGKKCEFNPPTPTQMQIMEYLLKNQNKEVYQKDLESVLGLRRATVSGVLQTMEKNNLIRRITYNNDARVKRVIIHERTQEFFKEHKKVFLNIERVVTKDISDEELSMFLSIINKMKNNIEGYNK